MKILVIGNGFDKQHGLSTSYYDFVEYCEGITKYYDHKFKGGIVQYSAADKERYKELEMRMELFDEFFDLYENFWLKYFTEYKNTTENQWMDFEKTIEIVIKDILNDRENERKEGRSEDEISVRTIKKYGNGGIACKTYRELFAFLSVELKKFIRLLEIYLCVHVNNEMKGKERIDFISSIKPDKIISFNYTSTYTEIYNPMLECEYIHGEASDKRDYTKNDMVLGFDDHYFEKAEPILELVPFEKYYQRIVKRTGCRYFEWIDEKDEEGKLTEKQLYFYGHSMSVADGDILRKLILSPNTKTIIMYRKDHEEDRASMIQNLALVLSPDELIKRIGGNNHSIEFVAV